MSKFKVGDAVLYNNREPGIVIEVNSDEGDFDYDVELNNGTEITKTFSNNLKPITRFEQLKHKKNYGPLSRSERIDYIHYYNQMENEKENNPSSDFKRLNKEVESLFPGLTFLKKAGKRKSRKIKKRKTRKETKKRRTSKRKKTQGRKRFGRS
jgi:hypothetical protein